jgi:hypothetical protein
MSDDLSAKDIRQEFEHLVLSVKENSELVPTNIDDFDRDSVFYDALFLMTINLGRTVELANIWAERFKQA